MKAYCECPDTGVAPNLRLYSREEISGARHPKGKCPCTHQLAEFIRKQRILTLCSCCHRMGDKRV